uniref:Family with sequence similarity 237 member B n=1 Tax=Cyprinus carpio TaxID=7962 RepID=A0A8C1ZX25_CYPCA
FFFLILLLFLFLGGGKAPGQLGEINRECWDASSLAVIQARKLPVAETVAGLWDFMTYLSGSNQPKHQDMFMELAQVFWERYVDCVLARAHGLGRRSTTTMLKYTVPNLTQSSDVLC